MEHLKADLGQLKRGSTVVVTLDKQANVLLMDASNYRTYSQARGGHIRYVGGLIKRSPARLGVPSDGHWFLAIDLGGAGGTIRHSVSIVPPPRGNLPEYRQPVGRAVADEVSTRRPVAPQTDDDLDGRTWDVFLSHASEDKALSPTRWRKPCRIGGSRSGSTAPSCASVTAFDAASTPASAAAGLPRSFSARPTSPRGGLNTSLTAS